MVLAMLVLVGCQKEGRNYGGKNCLFKADDLTKLVEYLKLKELDFEKKGNCIYYKLQDRGRLKTYKKELFGIAPPSGRSTSFGARNEEIQEKLARNGIQVHVHEYRGKEFLVFSQEDVEKVGIILNYPPEQIEMLKKMRNDKRDN